MTTIDVTPAAAVEIRKRLQALSLPKGCAVVFRPTKQANLRRGPDGEAVWTVEHPAREWLCGVLPLPMDVPGYEPGPILDIEGLPFTLCGESSGDDALHISLVDGNLHVERSRQA